jgi:hypothetical protein
VRGLQYCRPRVLTTRHVLLAPAVLTLPAVDVQQLRNAHLALVGCDPWVVTLCDTALQTPGQLTYGLLAISRRGQQCFFW